MANPSVSPEPFTSPVSAPTPSGTDKFSTLCYKKPFLNNAILRVDFSGPAGDLSKGLVPAVSKAALKYFPISQPQKAVAHELQISGGDITRKQTESTIWAYHGRNREKTLTIEPTAVVVARQHYSTYEEFKEEFFHVLMSFLDAYPDAVISRFGIRYINEIVFRDDASPTDWRDYLDSRLLALFDFVPDHTVLARLFNVVELNVEDLQIKFQFGMHNPDYPANIRQKSFVLDIDAYKVGLQDRADVIASVDRAHAKVQELFERSITEKVREEMM